MKYKDADLNVDNVGGCLQGEVKANFKDLVRVFGENYHNGDDYKCDAEWIIKFEDGVIASIYNWKDGHNYCGEEGLDVEDITCWHIGGMDKRCVANVAKVLAENKRKTKPKMRTLTGDELINEIAEVLRQGDASFIRDIANKVIVPRVKIGGENKFVQELD